MKPTHSVPRVVFAHGKESGPWGRKITHLAAAAEKMGFAVDSPDYSGAMDASARLAQLQALAPTGAPLVLVGSSMGGYVSAMACARLRPSALLLMAPALYLTGYPGEPEHCPMDTVVAHGWRDDVVPPAVSLDFARPRRAALHMLDDDHGLAASVDFIATVFRSLLQRALDRP